MAELASHPLVVAAVLFAEHARRSQLSPNDDNAREYVDKIASVAARDTLGGSRATIDQVREALDFLNDARPLDDETLDHFAGEILGEADSFLRAVAN